MESIIIGVTFAVSKGWLCNVRVASCDENFGNVFEKI